MTFFYRHEPKFAQIAVRARGNLSADEINTLVAEVENEILEFPGIKASTPDHPHRRCRRVAGVDRQVGRCSSSCTTKTSGSERHGDSRAIRAHRRRLPASSVEVQKMEQGRRLASPCRFSSPRLQRAAGARGGTRFAATWTRCHRLARHRRHPVAARIEWKLRVDRAQAALYNADVSLVGIAVQLITNGVKVGEYRPDNADDAVDIRVRYPIDDRGIAALDELKITTRDGLVPISNFVKREPRANVDTIQRIDGKVGGSSFAPTCAQACCRQTRCKKSSAGSQRQTSTRGSTSNFAAPTRSRASRWRSCSGVSAVAAADVRAAGDPVQQPLPEHADPVRRGACPPPASARTAGHEHAFQRDLTGVGWWRSPASW